MKNKIDYNKIREERIKEMHKQEDIVNWERRSVSTPEQVIKKLHSLRSNVWLYWNANKFYEENKHLLKNQQNEIQTKQRQDNFNNWSKIL